MGVYSDLSEEYERDIILEHVNWINNPSVPKFKKNLREFEIVQKQIQDWNKDFIKQLEHEKDFNKSLSQPIGLICLRLLKKYVKIDDIFTRYFICSKFIEDRCYTTYKSQNFGKDASKYFHTHSGSYWIKEGYHGDYPVYRRIK
jgi:hypothetical protein